MPSTPARGLARALGHADEIAGVAFFLVMVVSVSIGVVSRYGFGRPLIWPEEVSSFSFLWAVFLGAAAAARRHEHIVIDTVVAAFPPPLQRAVAVGVGVAVALMLAAITVLGVQYALSQRGTTTEALEMPVVLWALAVPLSCAIAFVYAVRDLVRALGGDDIAAAPR